MKEVEGNVVMTKEDFDELISEIESLIETVEILSDKNLVKQIKESERDIEEGRVSEIKKEDVLKELFLK
jgi:PHD/YefM family antitoxin component YafN of YafNO toxin-antitoxin module